MSDTGEELVPKACFASIKPLQVAVGRHFAASQRAFKSSTKGGSRQKIYQCSGEPGGCKAEVRANKNKSTGEWHVHKVNSDHTGCSGGNTTGRSSAFSAVARQALNDNPELQGIKLKHKIERDSGIKVSHRTATRMKNAEQKLGQTAILESYKQLPSFCVELEKNCPGTVAKVEKNPDGSFRRLGIVIGRAAYACRRSPLKVIYVDAGHMKGEWRSVMLIATFKDANNTLVHLATVICDKENSDNYASLYRLMKENDDLDSVLGSNKTTLFTDQHKSHEPAVASECKNVVLKWCLRHIVGNLGQKVGQAVNSWIFHAARAPSAQKFQEIMETHVKPTKPIAFEALMALDRTKWTMHAGPPDTVIGDQTTSNPVEQNMNMIGADARKLPPLELLVAILDKTGLRMAEKAVLGEGTQDKLTPFAATAFEAQRYKSRT